MELRVHDFLVQKATAVGINERLLEKLVTLPEIVFHRNLKDTVKDADAIVVMHADERYDRLVRNSSVPVLNVARWGGL